jgi:hypothetical protein
LREFEIKLHNKGLMGAASSTYGGEERDTRRILVETLKKRDHLEDLGVDRRIILERILKKCDGRA